MNPVRGTARQRALARAVSDASWLACRMPEAPLVARCRGEIGIIQMSPHLN